MSDAYVSDISRTQFAQCTKLTNTTQLACGVALHVNSFGTSSSLSELVNIKSWVGTFRILMQRWLGFWTTSPLILLSRFTDNADRLLDIHYCWDMHTCAITSLVAMLCILQLHGNKCAKQEKTYTCTRFEARHILWNKQVVSLDFRRSFLHKDNEFVDLLFFWNNHRIASIQMQKHRLARNPLIKVTKKLSISLCRKNVF